MSLISKTLKFKLCFILQPLHTVLHVYLKKKYIREASSLHPCPWGYLNLILVGSCHWEFLSWTICIYTYFTRKGDTFILPILPIFKMFSKINRYFSNLSQFWKTKTTHTHKKRPVHTLKFPFYNESLICQEADSVEAGGGGGHGDISPKIFSCPLQNKIITNVLKLD